VAIEVLTRGIAPLDVTYEVWCQCCRSHLRFKRQDATPSSDQRDGDALKITCPVCTATVWARP